MLQVVPISVIYSIILYSRSRNRNKSCFNSRLIVIIPYYLLTTIN